MNAARPTMFLVVGPDGAGKSTMYGTLIRPQTAAPFINEDVIQREELKDLSMSAAATAAQVAESRRRRQLVQREDFVSESVFSDRSDLELVVHAKATGFRIVLYHVNVLSAELCVHRVAARVAEGGHHVSEARIRERYERNSPLIREAVRLSDRAYVYDNSRLNTAPAQLIRFKDGRVTLATRPLPSWAQTLYSEDLEERSRGT